MTAFSRYLSPKIDAYVSLRRSLGHAFRKQAGTLAEFQRWIDKSGHRGPLTGRLAVAFVLSCPVTPNERAWRYGVIRRFAEYFSIFDPATENMDPHALPRSRAIPPPRILDDAELAALLRAAHDGWHHHPIQGLTLFTIIGLLASTGLRSGEVVRLDRSDVNLSTGILRIRQTKFRKDRIVPVHPSTRKVLRRYALARDKKFPQSRSSAFFLSIRGERLSASGFAAAFRAARDRAGLREGSPRELRPHDLRHRFAVTRLALWHRERVDVQAQLPILATYLGHAHYTDTAYYVTATAELLSLAAERAFGPQEGER